MVGYLKVLLDHVHSSMVNGVPLLNNSFPGLPGGRSISQTPEW